jgi:spore maturation protein CgeB
MNLNVHHPSDVKADAPNMRVFEVAGSGGLLLSDRVPSIHRYFGVKYYLENPGVAEEMGKRAAERCRRKHTYAHRARTLLEASA